MNKLRILILFIALTLCFESNAQDVPQELQLILEQFLEDQELEEFDVSDIIIRLESYQQNPLNINKADYEDFKDLMLLTDIQIDNILNHRNEYGDFIRLEELQVVPNMDLESIKRISYFVSVKDPTKFQNSILRMMSEGKNEVFLKTRTILEEQKGYIKDEDGNAPFAGNNDRYFLRYRHNYENRLRYGITMEKDAGEDFFRGSNRQGFDYTTAHIYLKDYSYFLKDIVVGDYSFSLGQGLIEHNNFGSGKSSWVTSIKKGGRVFKPYNSVNENDYFRGVGATIRPIENLELSLMGSFKKVDATVIEPEDGIFIEPDNLDLEISSIRIDGYHRTESEIKNKRAITSLQTGGILKYKQKNYHIALNYLRTDFGAVFQPNTRLYRKFQQLPSTLNNISADYALRIKNWHFFGEVATNNGRDWAQLHGLLLGLDKTISAAVLYRKYSPGYIAVSPNAFGESSTIQNEEGIYLGLEIRPVYAWKFSVYGDIWNNPWLRFQIDRPSQGKEYLARLDYIIKRKLNIYTQYAYEVKERNFNPSDSGTNSLANVNRHKVRMHLSYKLNKSLELRSRLELSYFEQGGVKSKGMMMYQDFIYKPISSPVRITARYAIFDTDDFNTRIYAYENDILYEFYIPAFANRGSRFYVNLRYDLTRWMTAELRYARTQYENLTEISSGNNQILGDTQTEVKAQLVFKF